MNFAKRITLTLLVMSVVLQGQEGLEINAGADIVSRYIWRGLMVNDAPNIQPSITMGYGGFELGLWGSSTLAKTNSSEDNYAFSHEVDFWAGYNFQFTSGMAIGVVITDYYFPNGGVKFGNVNNYDAADGAGAHTLETGITLSGPETFPINFSAFMNVHNDGGKNTYFQVDYSTEYKTLGFDYFIGAAGGSDKNPGYYGTENLNIINLGISVNKAIKFSESFSLPFFVSFIANPRSEVSYLICGVSF